MAIMQRGAIRPRSTDGSIGGVAAAPPAVGSVHEDALCSILHHSRLDLLHHLAKTKHTLATACRMPARTSRTRHDCCVGMAMVCLGFKVY